MLTPQVCAINANVVEDRDEVVPRVSACNAPRGQVTAKPGVFGVRPSTVQDASDLADELRLGMQMGDPRAVDHHRPPVCEEDRRGGTAQLQAAATRVPPETRCAPTRAARGVSVRGVAAPLQVRG